jgi:replicative DNA helicase
MLSLDYIKRIRPTEKGRDEKEELKNISNELKSLAIHYDIPVVTAHQLNRQAAATVDAALQANKEDLAKFLGRANIGSSWELVENADVLIILNVEKKRQTGQQYLTFKRVKIRYKDMSDLTYFNHPFNPNNKMQLLDDIYLDHSLSEDSLVADFDAVDLGAKKGKRNAVERETINTDEDLFMFGKSLGTKT